MSKKICERCGESFFDEDGEMIFNIEHPLCNYSYITKCLCGNCANIAVSDEEPGIYYEFCENCGKQFDPFSEDSIFRSHSQSGLSLSDLSKIVCSDCGFEQEMKDYPLEDEI